MLRLGECAVLTDDGAGLAAGVARLYVRTRLEAVVVKKWFGETPRFSGRLGHFCDSEMVVRLSYFSLSDRLTYVMLESGLKKRGLAGGMILVVSCH